MEHRNPYELLRETARRRRRRTATNLLLPLLPPSLAIGILELAGLLPIELAAAGAIALTVALLLAGSLPSGQRDAARMLDRALDLHDHFLTLATVERSAPFLPLVEDHASRRAAEASPCGLLPPVSRRPLAWSAFLSLALVAALWIAPATVRSPDRVERLEAVAEELAASDLAADRQLAQELRRVVDTLRDPRRSAAEKRAAAEHALEQLEEDSGEGSGRGSKGEQGEGASGGDLRGQAQAQLEELSGSGGTSGESSPSSGPPSPSQAGESDDAGEGERSEGEGGVNAPNPPRGAGERSGEAGEGNRPAPEPGEARDRGQGQGESRSDSSASKPPQAGAEGGTSSQGTGDRGTGREPPRGGDTESAEPAGAGEGADGWRIVDGRYVRVRVPEEGAQATETDRVRKPGEIAAEARYGNAPLPEAGAPGDVRESQPLPLEYRDVLRGREGGDR